jgi:hypothetical protein
MFKSIIIISSFLILLITFNNFTAFITINSSFSQIASNKNIDKVNSWISKKDNLNITITLDPKIPIVDKSTKISFDVKKLNNSINTNFTNLTAKVTIADSDGRIFKFAQQNIIDNKFIVNYIFPTNGTDRIILQIYKNEIPFAIGSIDLNVPIVQSQPSSPDNNFFTNLFKGL